MRQAPEAGSARAPRPSRLRRWARRLAFLLALLVLLGVFRNVLIAPLLVAWLEGEVAEAGGRLEIGSVGGTWVSSLELADVTYRGPVGSDDLVVESAHVNAEYSLLGFLRDEEEWLHRVEVAADLVDYELGPEEGSWSHEIPIELVPEVHLEVGRLAVSAADLGASDLVISAASADDLTLSSSSLEISGVAVENVAGRARIERRALAFDELTAEARDNRIELTDVVFPLVEETALGNLRLARARLRLQSSSVGELPLPAGTSMGGLELGDATGRLSGELADAEISLAGRVDTRYGELVLERMKIGPFDGAFSAAPLDLDFELDVRAGRVAPLAALLDVEAAGALNADVQVTGSMDAPRGLLLVEAEGLTIEGVELGQGRGSLRLEEDELTLERLEIESRRWNAILRAGWSLGTDGEPIRVEELSVASSQGSIQARGAVEHAGAPFAGWETFTVRLDALRATRDDQELELARPARAVYDTSGLRTDDLELTGDVGHLRARASSAADGMHVEVTVAGFDPMPFASPFLPADFVVSGVDGTVSMHREAQAIRFEADLTAGEVIPVQGRLACSADLRAALSDGRLTVEAFDVRHGDLGEMHLSGEAPFDPLADQVLADGELALTGRFDAGDVGGWVTFFGWDPVDVDGVLHAELDLAGSWARPTGELRVEMEQLGTEDLVEAQRAGLAGLTIEVELGDEIRLTTCSVKAEEIECLIEGRIAHALDGRRLAVGEVDDLLDAPVELSARASLPRLAWLSNPRRRIRRLGGSLEGQVVVSGTLRSPDLAGELSLDGGELRMPDPVPPLRAVSGRLAFVGGEVRIEGLRGELGSAPFELTGRVALSDPLELDLAFRGESVLIYRDIGTRVRGNGDLRLAGPLTMLTLSGEIALTDSQYTRDIDLLGGIVEGSTTADTLDLQTSFFRDPPLSNLRFDVAIRTNDPFVVRSNLARGTLRPELVLRGTGEFPTLDGVIRIDPTRVVMPSGRVDIEAGRITFQEQAPFRPELDMLARGRLRGYDVTAHISVVDEQPVIELSSIPPLPQDDLLLLFLTGQVPRSQGGESGAGAAEAVAVFLTADYVQRWLGTGATEEESLLDRLELDVGSEVSSSGMESLALTYYLTPRPTEPGRARYLRAERDRFDQTAFSYGILFRFK